MKFDEQCIMKTILSGMDWQDVLTTIVMEEEMDPWGIDIVKLADLFVNYLKKMKQFDFRIPARFILVAAILLRMKCEILFQEEEEVKERGEKPLLNIENIPKLTPPLTRIPTRRTTLNELITALNKALAFKERKEIRLHKIRKVAIDLIEPTEDIENKIKRIHRKIVGFGGFIKFSELVPEWEREEIVDYLMPLLHLVERGLINMFQEEMFDEIYIRIK